MGAVGRFKLADGKRGGVLKEIRRITVTGTKGYMAPEVAMLIGTSRDASRRGYTSAVDWWSLGATLFKMVTGKRPYDIEVGSTTLL
jgi:serine/threonine protein kinase